MIYFVKFSKDGHAWRFCYAQEVNELDDQLELLNAQYQVPTLQNGKMGIRVIKEKKITVDCSEGAFIAFVFRFRKPSWFQEAC